MSQDQGFYRCPVCGQVWSRDQTYTRLTDERGNFLSPNQQLVSSIWNLDDPARPICQACQAAPLASAKPRIVTDLINLPVNLGFETASRPVATVHPAPKPPPRPAPPSPARFKTAQKPECSEFRNSFSDQLRNWEQKREEHGFLPKPGPDQVAFYLTDADGTSRFAVAPRSRAPVFRRSAHSSQAARVYRLFALTGEVIPETPLGLAATAGPFPEYLDTKAEVEEPREVDEIFESAQPGFPDWKSAPAPWLEIEETGDRSSLEIAERIIGGFAQEDPEFLERLSAFSDFIKSQN